MTHFRNAGLLLLITLLFSWNAHSAGKGGSSIGAFIGTTGATQTDVNSLIAVTGGSKLTSGLEFSGHYTYRFSGSIIAMQFRPSYFTSSVSSGGVSYSVTGFTLFPIFKMYWLESNYIKFFTQVGLGWGFASGEIKEASANAKFSSNNMGAMAGLGAEFCFFGGSHCVDVEGSFRYLPFVRNVVDSSSGTLSSGATTTDKEIEFNNADLGTTFSGIMGVLGYNFYF